MPLDPGARLGVYEILGPLGAGGMGEVYRARDTKLEREVAIKVLPDELSRDRERLARFEREARLLAGLNHPSIATLYGLESIDERQLLIMEFVEGETLAERIARGPIPLDEALPLFVQISEGLAAAHDNGVVHRDLKPANIKITPDGNVKILDFGLAKAFDPQEAPEQETSQSPTLTKGTAMGVILGTAPYMSPEQARGKNVDKRTDIWAFGCCLYESLTGVRTFDGETVTDTLAAIVNNEPRWERLPAEVPPRARILLERCLTKDANARKRDARDIGIDLSSEGAPETETRGTRASALSIPLALVSALVAGLLVWSITRGPATDASRTTRLEIYVDEDQDLQPGLAYSSPVAFSPDGTRLVYAARVGESSRLFLRRLDAFEALPIPNTEGAWHPFFSPDGEWVGFDRGGGVATLASLDVVSLKGGVYRSLAEHVPIGASWTDDGNVVFGSRGGMWSVPANGGESTALLRTETEERALGFPQRLPGGAGVLFTDRSGVRSRVAVLSLKTDEVEVLEELGEGGGARYLPSGHLIYARNGTMLAAPFDLSRLDVTGPPTVVLEAGASVTVNGHERPLFSVSDAGHLAYVAVESSTKRRLVWVDRRGREELLEPAGLAPYEYLALSPDGSRVAYTKHDGQHSSWVYDLERQTETRLTLSGVGWAVWAPEGRTLAFATNGNTELYGKNADGSGEAELLLSTTDLPLTGAGAWSPNGDGLVYVVQDANARMDLWILKSDGDSVRLFETSFDEFQPVFSPDGRFLAYVSNESGVEEVYVRSYPVLDERWLISRDGGREPRWSRDGRELFYRRDRAMMVVSVETDSGFSAPALLFEGDFYGGEDSGYPDYDVSPDGSRFLMIRDEPYRRIHVVLNWFSELERLVPIP